MPAMPRLVRRMLKGSFAVLLATCYVWLVTLLMRWLTRLPTGADVVVTYSIAGVLIAVWIGRAAGWLATPRERAERRRRRGMCPACDFDLRYTPARCPECGTGKQCF